jgi:hypothetical protein
MAAGLPRAKVDRETMRTPAVEAGVSPETPSPADYPVVRPLSRSATAAAIAVNAPPISTPTPTSKAHMVPTPLRWFRCPAGYGGIGMASVGWLTSVRGESSASRSDKPLWGQGGASRYQAEQALRAESIGASTLHAWRRGKRFPGPESLDGQRVSRCYCLGAPPSAPRFRPTAQRPYRPCRITRSLPVEPGAAVASARSAARRHPSSG